VRVRHVDPPRRFRVGEGSRIELRHVADMELEPDEVVTFRAPSGSEADVTRKAWGYYWTGSLNERLPAHGLEPVIVRGADGKTFLMLVEADRGQEFLDYCAAERLTPERWLGRDA
jgi:hypothetical protein